MSVTERKPKTTVLVVEDSSTVRKLIARDLTTKGYQVIQAASMEDAMTGGGAGNVDLIVSDIYLPGISGLEGIRTIRARWPDSRIIAMSAGEANAGRDDTLIKARWAGADAAIQKPFSMDQLVRKLEFLMKVSSDGHQKRGFSVLVIDDSKMVLKLVGRMLADSEFEVHLASSMEDALGSWEIVGVDVVLTDIFMPGLSGIEGIQAIREAWPNVRIVAMSGGLDGKMGDDKALRAADRVGADATLKKPFEQDDVLAVLYDLIGSM